MHSCSGHVKSQVQLGVVADGSTIVELDEDADVVEVVDGAGSVSADVGVEVENGVVDGSNVVDAEVEDVVVVWVEVAAVVDEPVDFVMTIWSCSFVTVKSDCLFAVSDTALEMYDEDGRSGVDSRVVF
jgi:hypothetical protein